MNFVIICWLIVYKRSLTVDGGHFLFFLCIFVHGRWQPTQSQLIQRSTAWSGQTFTTLNTEQNQLAIKVSADNQYYRNVGG